MNLPQDGAPREVKPKLTRSEAARLGGLARAAKLTAERRSQIAAEGAASPQRLTTLLQNHPDHFREMGRAGFKSLCRKFPGNSRRLALHHLGRKGAVQARYVPHQRTAEDDAAAAEMYRAAGLDDDDGIPY